MQSPCELETPVSPHLQLVQKACYFQVPGAGKGLSWARLRLSGSGECLSPLHSILLLTACVTCHMSSCVLRPFCAPSLQSLSKPGRWAFLCLYFPGSFPRLYNNSLAKYHTWLYLSLRLSASLHHLASGKYMGPAPAYLKKGEGPARDPVQRSTWGLHTRIIQGLKKCGAWALLPEISMCSAWGGVCAHPLIPMQSHG